MKALTSAILFVALAACGGSTTVDPIFRPDQGQGGGNGSNANGTPTTNPPNNDPPPVAPIGPYTGLVGTTDVSILYPMPAKGASSDFVKPSEAGVHGALLPKAAFDTIVPGGALETTFSEPKSGYAELALVSVRLDHCSARKGTGCTPEIRAVFQAVNDASVLQPGGVGGMAAADGALHVIYDISETELITTVKQILTLKQAQGGLALQILDVHPILAQQGLGGEFAKGLRSILLEHLGGNRIARITTFDHNNMFDEDGWKFQIFDRSGETFVAKQIPKLAQDGLSQFVVGSNAAAAPMKETRAQGTGSSMTADNVEPLLSVTSTEQMQNQGAYDAALRIQNPTLHNAETTDCGNCHLAEGARIRAKAFHNFSDAAAFKHARNLGYKTDRTSVTNLHAFGWLGRQVSIMQRTANESVVVADFMEQKVK